MTVILQAPPAAILPYTPEVAAATAATWAKVERVLPEDEWRLHAPFIERINRLKKQRNAVILAHNYMSPEIFHGVADIVGDSLALAKRAEETDADVIVMAGVHFMAETAKLLNPDKIVLMPDMEAGCSLAESIRPEDIRLLREAYPDAPVVTYVNTSAAVKAESDICCTSGNAVEVVESLGAERVLCLPDEYLANWVATQTKVKILTWKGHCEVHERFTPDEIRRFRRAYDDLVVIAHPECPPEVIAAADFAGSTAKMIDYVRDEKPARVLMITECSMSDNIAAASPTTDFVRPCIMCPHMKRISLPKILHALETLEPRVEVDPAVAVKARRAVERMIAVGRRK
ncbi:quinolinate synthase NadA [Zavarzinia aquatilis]|uniref:Quinolinate synthase n=1 Tax=Zavarzinia aquatilis TaxID=2211142 RepID=A0A317EGA0_9PROT|nr:quinolinate synthase NadA [Zavarzinia aquatilis]PWR25781.1 quinolinate synthase [Zavarzinia aquatilis]